MTRMIAGLALAFVAVSPAVAQAATMTFDCRGTAASSAPAPDLAGSWDLVMDVGGIPSFGLLSLGRSGTEFAGSVALNAGVAVVRSMTLTGRTVAMIVTTGEGDVRFDGDLGPDGRRMCGIVNYHGGQRYEMVAQKKPDRGPRPAR